jgi:ferredoxin--NADP+ reductase
MSTQTTPNAPVFPDAKMNLVTPKAPVQGTVVSNDLCMKGKSNSFVRHTEIDVSGTPLEGSFLAGQSFGVIAPGVDENGKPHKVRLYSIACPTWGEDGQARVLSTTPKRLIDERKPQKSGDDPADHGLFIGVCSNFLCDLRPGDAVSLTGPNGKRFLLPVDPGAHDFIFVATGTGIAPFRGFVMELLENPRGRCESQIHLIMGSPYTTDLLYDDLFTTMAAKHDNFYYHTAISRERRPDGSRGIYVDKVFAERIDDFRPLLESPRTLMYQCGLEGMQYNIFRNMQALGVGEPYFTIKDELQGVDPWAWEDEQIRRLLRPTERCMLEVY